MKYVIKTCLLLTLIGLSLSIKAQAPGPLDGIMVTSYSATANVEPPLSPASLTWAHTDNSGFLGSELSGDDTGDATVGADWDLEIFGLNYDSILEGGGNLLGLNMSADTSGFQLGDTQTISFGLTFGTDQLFQAVNPAFGVSSTTPTFASLTPSGGSTENLLALPANTLFPAGDYILSMGGEITTETSYSALAAQFTAIPEPSVLAFVLIGMVLFTKAFRARKR